MIINSMHFLSAIFFTAMAQTFKKCHSGPCGPCKLCQKPSTKYTHPTDTEYEFLCGLKCGNVNKDA